MTSDMAALFTLCGMGIVLVLLVGFYGLLVTRSLVRTMIALEILTKAVTLLIIVAGYSTKQVALAQTLAITLIIIEVAVIVVALSIVLCVHKNTGSVDVRNVQNLKG
jgi:NADH:ubiquinone oxidoreductase subunit K